MAQKGFMLCVVKHKLKSKNLRLYIRSGSIQYTRIYIIDKYHLLARELPGEVYIFWYF